MTALLEMRGVRHRHGEKTVLAIDSLMIPEGGIVGLVGPNGSGKSTLLKLLALVENCAEGEILFRGERVKPFDDRARGRIALLPQEAYLLRRTVFENVAYGLRVAGKKEGLADRVAHALALVGLGGSHAARPWHELSGGEAQRVALAARLALRPECLLLDEPTASVDGRSAMLIREAVLAARREWGAGIVIASHQRDWLDGICDRLLFLHDGLVIGVDTVNILYGPWMRLAEGGIGRRLPGGQELVVSTPPGPDSCCLLDPGRISVRARETGDAAGDGLSGVVAAAFLEKDGGVALRVDCGGLMLTARVSPDDGRLFHPGREVWLSFPPSAVAWLDSQ